MALLLDGQVKQAVRALTRIGVLSPLPWLDILRVVAWRSLDPGWRLRCLPVWADRLPLHLGVPDELRSADIPRRRSSIRAAVAARPSRRNDEP